MRGLPAPGWIAALVLLAAACPDAHAVAGECDSAASACTDQCRQPSLRDLETGAPLGETDFSGLCEFACVTGHEPCKLQRTREACATYYTRCVNACPWSIAIRETGAVSNSTNSIHQCMAACSVGRTACLTEKPVERERKRHVSLDVCEEAQSTCYTSCMPIEETPGTFPERCVKACLDGLAPCQTARRNVKCKEFGANCLKLCPEDRYDLFSEIPTGIPEGQKCTDACTAGEKHCQKQFER